jgi:hypothetical protein
VKTSSDTSGETSPEAAMARTWLHFGYPIAAPVDRSLSVQGRPLV